MLAQATNVVADVAKVVHDLAPTISTSDILTTFGVIVAVARILRKVIPDAKQVGTPAQILKHLALEINPTTPPAVVAKPSDTKTF